jgi:two-component system phosphate regulon sensor histidine kinase PhoR
MPANRLRLLAALGSLLALVALGSGLLARMGARERALAAAKRDLERAAGLVREFLGGHPLSSGSAAALHKLGRQAARALELRVTLIAADGRVVADSEVELDALDHVADHADRPEVKAALAGRTGTAQRHSATVGEDFLYVAIPRQAERPGTGAIRLARDLVDVERDLAGLERAILSAGALGLAAGLLALALWLRAAYDRPLARVRAALARIEAGDLSARTRLRRRGAVGEIAAAIDQMAGELEQRLREVTEEKEQLSGVLGGMVEGVLVVGPDGRIQLANRSMLELFGIRGELVGKRPIEAIRSAAVEDALREAARAGSPVVRELSLGTSPARALRLHASSFATAEGAGVVAVFSDVTEVRRVEAMRRDFVTHASHELKTPITAIRGFAEMLAEGGVPAADQPRVLEIVRSHVERLERLVEDLLELARAESDEPRLEPRPLDLVALARSALEGLEGRLVSQQLRAELVDGGAGRALADPGALEQVLANLLDNALKYTEPGGRVSVRVADDGEYVRLSVADTGIGIPETDRVRIFERFYRVDKARSRALGGTGLGLAIVKHLVQAMHGEVSVESVPGAGSTFHVRLPRAP